MGAFPFNQDGVYGAITTTEWTAANSPYRVAGQCTVKTGNTLTIESGVDVLFDADVQFVVEGAINALGTESDSIRFLKGAANEWGGIRISGGDSSSFAYLRISDGHADGSSSGDTGGAVYSTGPGTRLAMKHCVIAQNEAVNAGGGLFNCESAEVSLNSCTFRNNTASSGGGLYNYGPATVALENCMIRGNGGKTADASGGGLQNSVDGAIMTLFDCTVTGNDAYSGGGLYNGSGATATLNECTIQGNTTTSTGGTGAGVHNRDADATITKCLFVRNMSEDDGGAVFNTGENAALNLMRCTLSGNQSDSDNNGGALLNTGNGTAEIQDCIVWGNGPITSIYASSGEVAVSYSCIEMGITHNVSDSGGNIAADPLFTDAPNADYTLTSGSPCIDAGDPAPEYYDPDGTRADMGAFYFDQGPLGPSIVTSELPDAMDGVDYVTEVRAERDTAAALTFHLLSAPSWLALAPSSDTTASLSGTPGQSDTTEAATVQIRVANQEGVADTATFSLAVLDTNYAPLLVALSPGAIEGSEADEASLSFTVTDHDLDSVTVALSPDTGSVAFMGRADSVITFRWSWTPSYADSGTYHIELAIMDVPAQGLLAVQTVGSFDIRVENVNRPPVWKARPDTTAKEGVLLSFVVAATDPDGDELTYSADSLPSGATFDGTTGTFSWTPGFLAAGLDTAIFQATDGKAFVYDTVAIAVADSNRAPTITTATLPDATEGRNYAATITVEDPDTDDEWTVELTTTAGWIDTAWSFPHYALSGIPMQDDTTSALDIMLEVRDGHNAGTSETYAIQVIDVCSPPIFSGLPDTARGRETEMLSATFDLIDADYDSVTLSAAPDSGAVSFVREVARGRTERQWVWTPGYFAAGTHEIVFTATDVASGSCLPATTKDTLVVEVENMNRLPVWAARPDTSTDEGSTLSFQVLATDPDLETLTYDAVLLPNGASFDASTQAFTWTPGYHDAGVDTAVFSVTDEDSTVLDTLMITVNDIPVSPVWSEQADTSVMEGDSLTFVVSAIDPDEEPQPLKYSAVELPAGATFDTAAQRFGWRPGFNQAGDTLAVFQVTDGPHKVSYTVQIRVDNSNQPPSWDPAPQAHWDKSEGDTLRINLTAQDDGNVVSYSLVSGGVPDSITGPTQDGVFEWRLSHDLATAGSSADSVLVFRATDDDRDDRKWVEAEVTVTIHDVNRPPGLEPVPEHLSMVKGREITFAVTPTDPDNDTDLSCNLIEGPDGCTFQPGNRRFTWIRRSRQEPETFAVFRVWDSSDSTDTKIPLKADTTNALPRLDASLPDTISWDCSFSIDLGDDDGDPVSVSGRWVWGENEDPAAIAGDTVRRAPEDSTVIWRTSEDFDEAFCDSVQLILLGQDLPGEVASTCTLTTSILNLAADWTHSGKITLSDFDTLTTALGSNDLAKDIGPFDGHAPNIRLRPLKPGERLAVDFEDFMAFAFLWDWADVVGRVEWTHEQAGRLARAGRGAGVLTAEATRGDLSSVDLRLPAGLEASVVSVAVVLPKKLAKHAELVRPPGTELWLCRRDTARSVVEAWMAPGGDASNGLVARLELPAGWEEVEFDLAYEIHSRGSRTPIIGYTRQSVSLIPLPTQYRLSAAPNPFNPVTTIRYEVPAKENVRLCVYNVFGQRIAVLVDAEHEPGRYMLSWHGTDATGRAMGSGVYLLRLTAGTTQILRRVTLVK